MSDRSPEFHPSPTAQEMADALRRRTMVERHARSGGPGMEAARFSELGDLEGLPPLAKPGVTAPFVKLARRVLQAFLRPWLATQTIFNREIGRRFDETHAAAADLERRMPHIELGLRHLEDRIVQLEARAADARSHARGTEPAPMDFRALEQMFLHSRLPHPPGQVLSLYTDAPSVPLELASFGYDVWSAAHRLDAAHPRLHAYERSTQLPFADETFDAVVGFALVEERATDGSDVALREVARVLKRDGRVLVSVCGSSGRAVLTPRLAPLVAVDIIRAERAGPHWQVTARDPDPAKPAPQSAVILIDARKPDASGR